MLGVVAKAGPVLLGELLDHSHGLKPRTFAQLGAVGCNKADLRNCVSAYRAACAELDANGPGKHGIINQAVDLAGRDSRGRSSLVDQNRFAGRDLTGGRPWQLQFP